MTIFSNFETAIRNQNWPPNYFVGPQFTGPYFASQVKKTEGAANSL
jgi:hypothetical protein